jgi:hypothetical protein
MRPTTAPPMDGRGLPMSILITPGRRQRAAAGAARPGKRAVRPLWIGTAAEPTPASDRGQGARRPQSWSRVLGCWARNPATSAVKVCRVGAVKQPRKAHSRSASEHGRGGSMRTSASYSLVGWGADAPAPPRSSANNATQTAASQPVDARVGDHLLMLARLGDRLVATRPRRPVPPAAARGQGRHGGSRSPRPCRPEYGRC